MQDIHAYDLLDGIALNYKRDLKITCNGRGDPIIRFVGILPISSMNLYVKDRNLVQRMSINRLHHRA